MVEDGAGKSVSKRRLFAKDRIEVSISRVYSDCMLVVVQRRKVLEVVDVSQGKLTDRHLHGNTCTQSSATTVALLQSLCVASCALSPQQEACTTLERLGAEPAAAETVTFKHYII